MASWLENHPPLTTKINPRPFRLPLGGEDVERQGEAMFMAVNDIRRPRIVRPVGRPRVRRDQEETEDPGRVVA